MGTRTFGLTLPVFPSISLSFFPPKRVNAHMVKLRQISPVYSVGWAVDYGIRLLSLPSHTWGRRDPFQWVKKVPQTSCADSKALAKLPLRFKPNFWFLGQLPAGFHAPGFQNMGNVWGTGGTSHVLLVTVAYQKLPILIFISFRLSNLINLW